MRDPSKGWPARLDEGGGQYQSQIRPQPPLQYWPGHPHCQAVRRRSGDSHVPLPGGEDQNYSKTSGDFSDHGDSGSLIFTGDGDGLAILHSGMPRGMHNHITYGTPIWWVNKQILGKYPFADFYGMTYTLD